MSSESFNLPLCSDLLSRHVRNLFIDRSRYRQIQVALRLFAQNAIAADNPANDDFWLHDAATKEVA
jgi:hypothetical protein